MMLLFSFKYKSYFWFDIDLNSWKGIFTISDFQACVSFGFFFFFFFFNHKPVLNESVIFINTWSIYEKLFV